LLSLKLKLALRVLDVEGVGRINVNVVEPDRGRLCFKLTRLGAVPVLEVGGAWRGLRLAVVEVGLRGIETRECEYGLIDASIQGEEALLVALVYDRSQAKWRVLEAVLPVVEEELASRGVKKLRLLKPGPTPLSGFVDEGWALVKEVGRR